MRKREDGALLPHQWLGRTHSYSAQSNGGFNPSYQPMLLRVWFASPWEPHSSVFHALQRNPDRITIAEGRSPWCRNCLDPNWYATSLVCRRHKNESQVGLACETREAA